MRIRSFQQDTTKPEDNRQMKKFKKIEFAQWLKMMKAISSLAFFNDVLITAESKVEPDIQVKNDMAGLKYAEAMLGLARQYASVNDERLTSLCSNIRNALYWNGGVEPLKREKYLRRLNQITQGLTTTLCAQSIFHLASFNDYKSIYKFAFEVGYPDLIRREFLYRWIYNCAKPGDFRRLFKVILPDKPGKSGKRHIDKDGFFIRLILYRMQRKGVFKKDPTEEEGKK